MPQQLNIEGLDLICQEETVRIDSRLLARRFQVKHKNVRELIEKHQKVIGEKFGILPFETEKKKGPGQPAKYYLLDEDQALFLTTLTRNTEAVIQTKAALVRAFRKARDMLANAKYPRALSRVEMARENLRMQIEIEMREQMEREMHPTSSFGELNAEGAPRQQFVRPYYRSGYANDRAIRINQIEQLLLDIRQDDARFLQSL